MPDKQGDVTRRDMKNIVKGDFGPEAFNHIDYINSIDSMDTKERITASTNDAVKNVFQEDPNFVLMNQIFEDLGPVISENIAGLKNITLAARESFSQWFINKFITTKNVEEKFGSFFKENFIKDLSFILHSRIVQARAPKLIVSGLSSEALDKFFVGIFNETLAGMENEYNNSEPELSNVGTDEKSVLKGDKEPEAGESIAIKNVN